MRSHGAAFARGSWYTRRRMTEMPEHSPTGLVIPETFVPLDIPVPPNAASAFGYPDTALYVAFYWEPLGDELCYDDGRIAGTGTWHAFLQYRHHRQVSSALAPWNIGYSDEEAEHWLVLQSDESKAWIAGAADARVFLQAQHPPLPPLRMIDLARVREEIRVVVSQRSVTNEQMREMQSRQQEQLQRLLSYCESWKRLSNH